MNTFTQTCLVLDAVFSAYWLWAARRVKKAAQRQSHGSRALHITLFVASYLLAFFPFPSWGFLDLRLVPPSTFWGLLGVAICAAGLTFGFWARVTLGKNWSGAVTIKEGHELIQRGPYRLARHPMYTGILTSLLGAALTTGKAGNFFGPVLLLFAFTRKMAMEESYLTRHFGNRYLDYSKRVKRLIPYIY